MPEVGRYDKPVFPTEGESSLEDSSGGQRRRVWPVYTGISIREAFSLVAMYAFIQRGYAGDDLASMVRANVDAVLGE